MDGSAPVLAFKLFGTPLVIAGATLAGRRWGPTVTGWIGGMPLASGPLTYFLAIEQGVDFAAASATATLAGLVGVAAFGVAFSRLGASRSWPFPVGAGLIAFALVAGAMLTVRLSALAAFVAAVAALTAAIRLVGSPAVTVAAQHPPAWDIPARASVATGLVIGLSAAASALGARLVGVLAPFPVYASVMASFTHATEGHASSVRLLRGLLVGAYGFACFYLVVALVVTDGVVPAFVLATLAALAVQGTSMWVMRRLGW